MLFCKLLEWNALYVQMKWWINAPVLGLCSFFSFTAVNNWIYMLILKEKKNRYTYYPATFACLSKIFSIPVSQRKYGFSIGFPVFACKFIVPSHGLCSAVLIVMVSYWRYFVQGDNFYCVGLVPIEGMIGIIGRKLIM